MSVKALRERDPRWDGAGQSFPRPGRGPREGAYSTTGPGLAVAWLRRRYTLAEIGAQVGLSRHSLWSIQRGERLTWPRKRRAVERLIKWALADLTITAAAKKRGAA